MLDMNNVIDSFQFNIESRAVNLTDSALQRMASCLFAQANYQALVIAAEKGGCSGKKYAMSIVLNDTYAKQIGDFHTLCSINLGDDTRLVVTRNDSLLFIAGMTIDYVSSETGGGFLFSNPNAVNSCGCGESFNVGNKA